MNNPIYPHKPATITPEIAAQVVEQLIESVECIRGELSLVGVLRLERAKTLVEELRGEA